MNILRHGDISFHEIDKLPTGLTEIAHKGEMVLALGETTGHRHVLTVERSKILESKWYKDASGGYYVSLSAPATVTHEEHKLIEVPAGIYKINNEQEFDYFANSVVRVID